MAELGDGSGTGYPTALDTDSTLESAAKVTNYKTANDCAAAIIAIETELGTNPSLNKSTVKAYLQAEHSDDGKHTQKIAHAFYRVDAAADLAAVALNASGPITNGVTEIEMPWAGSIVGISVVSNDARTAGTLTVDATINGTVTGLQAVLNGDNTTHHSGVQAIDTDAFAAGDRLGVKITTDSGWLPITADVVVIVYVTFN